MKNYHYNKNKFCICGKIISNYAIRCHSCATKNSWKFGVLKALGRKSFPKCMDCNKELGRYNAKRCQKCYHIYAKNQEYNKGRNNPMFGKVTHGKRFKYKNIIMRSSWEVLYAEWLDFRNINWQYESKTFDLGDTTYTPDFYLPETDEYIEIKGCFYDKFHNKLKKFNLLFPNIKLKIIVEAHLKLGLYNKETDLIVV